MSDILLTRDFFPCSCSNWAVHPRCNCNHFLLSKWPNKTLCLSQKYSHSLTIYFFISYSAHFLLMKHATAQIVFPGYVYACVQCLAHTIYMWSTSLQDSTWLWCVMPWIWSPVLWKDERKKEREKRKEGRKGEREEGKKGCKWNEKREKRK